MEEWECGIHVDSKWIEFAIIIIKTEIKIQTPAAARRTFAALCRRCWRRCQCCGRRRRRHHRHRRSRELLLAVCLLLWKPAKFHLIGMPLPLPLHLLSSSFYFCFFFYTFFLFPLHFTSIVVAVLSFCWRRGAAQHSAAVKGVGFFWTDPATDCPCLCLCSRCLCTASAFNTVTCACSLWWAPPVEVNFHRPSRQACIHTHTYIYVYIDM